MGVHTLNTTGGNVEKYGKVKFIMNMSMCIFLQQHSTNKMKVCSCSCQQLSRYIPGTSRNANNRTNSDSTISCPIFPKTGGFTNPLVSMVISGGPQFPLCLVPWRTFGPGDCNGSAVGRFS